MHNEGGFMSNGENNQMVQGRKSEKEKINDTITPLLISWLNIAIKNSQEDTIKIDNIYLDKIKIVGRVVQYNN